MPFLENEKAYGISYDDFENRIYEFANEIESKLFDNKIQILPDEKVDKINEIQGHTESVGGKPYLITYDLPSEELYNNQEYSMFWIVRSVMTIFHECGHVYDFQNTYCDNTSIAAVYASMVHLICSSNERFALGSQDEKSSEGLVNYSHDINEVNAEYYAFTKSLNFIASHYPQLTDETIEKIFLDVVNNKITKHDSYYPLSYGTKEPMGSLNEIFSRHRASVRAAYRVPFVYNIDLYKDTDYLATYMSAKGLEDLSKHILELKNPVKQAFYFTVFCKGWEKGNLLKDYPSLWSIDFSREHMFRPFHIIPAVVKAKVEDFGERTIDFASDAYAALKESLNGIRNKNDKDDIGMEL